MITPPGGMQMVGSSDSMIDDSALWRAGRAGFPSVRKFQVFLKKSGKTDWSEKVRKKSGKNEISKKYL